jgi:exodeoxyribonuclease VII large subunit
VRAVANAVSQWIDRLGAVWVEGQLAQVTRRPGMATVFMTLRDTVADLSVTVTCQRSLFDSLNPPLVEGASVVVHAKPTFYVGRGSFSLQAREIRMVGLGELLARLERRRQLLAAEGLFAPELKRDLPFLPGLVGLVTASASAAERDVLENARRRWPGVRFQVLHTAMQGPRSAAEVIEAVERLDRHPEVDVIVVARGGGSIEDLLPFSDEALVRAVHGVRTPVVSAIGHEQDQPLLDLVADVRASTPTDAATLLVPDLEEELGGVTWARDRLRSLARHVVDREQDRLDALRARPAMADPRHLLDERAAEVRELRDRARRCLEHGLDRAVDDVAHHRARARSLSPLETLRRGYSVLQDRDGHVVTSVAGLAEGDAISVRVADGRVNATTTSTTTITESLTDHEEDPDG